MQWNFLLSKQADNIVNKMMFYLLFIQVKGDEPVNFLQAYAEGKTTLWELIYAIGQWTLKYKVQLFNK